MQRHFPHILKRLISPNQTLSHSGGFISRYFKNKQNLNYCRQLWPGTNKQTLINEAVNLRRLFKQAIQQEDKVLLLKVCSIPLFNQLKCKKIKQLNLGSWGYHFQLQNIYKVQSNLQQLSGSIQSVNKQGLSNQKGEVKYEEQSFSEYLDIKGLQWVRVEFKFKEQLRDRSLINRSIWIQRRVDEDGINGQKKWYIYHLQY